VKNGPKKALDLYQDATSDLWKADSDIEVVRRELMEVGRHGDAVADQIQKMKVGLGVACWPKPSLHPDFLEEVGGAFELEPCAFCNRW
jgi:hypothetical protein